MCGIWRGEIPVRMRTVQELFSMSQEWRFDVMSKLYCSSLALETRLFARQDFCSCKVNQNSFSSSFVAWFQGQSVG